MTVSSSLRLSRSLVVAGAVASIWACGDDPFISTDCPRGLTRDEAGLCVPDSDATDGGTDAGVDGGGGACTLSGVAIAEVLIDPDGADEGAEFIELSGRPGEDLTGATISIIGDDGTTSSTATLTGSIGANGLFVVGAGDIADQPLPGPLANAPGAVQLADCSGRQVDAVAWGTVTGGTFPGEGNPAPMPTEGPSLARCFGAADTNDNRSDFGLAAPSPGSGNPDGGFADAAFCGGTRPCTPGAVQGLRIEELLYNPDGTDAGSEFIELRGTPGTTLDGLRIVGINGDGGRELFPPVVLAGVIDETGLFVVGGASVRSLDFPLESTIQNGPDSIRVLDCDGVSVIDALAYGSFDADTVQAGEGAAAPAVAEGVSLSRCPAADDTGDNAADFGATAPTPGALAASTDFVQPDFCGGGGGGECTLGATPARIEEALPNPAGTDTGFEFVEISGTPDASAAGLVLRAINGGDGETLWEVALSGTFDGNGLLVVGGAEVEAATVLLESSLQNGPDSLQLLDCDGETLLDALGYGNFGEGDVFAGEGTAAPARDGLSLSRCPGAADTGDNARDFGGAAPSPGRPNATGDFDDEGFCGGVIPPECEVGLIAARIVEVLANPTGTDAGNEFVELSGTPGGSVTGAVLAGINGNGGTAYGQVRLAGTFDDQGIFVVGGDMIATRDQTLSFTLQNGPDSIVLFDCDGTTPLDAVGYGTFSETDVFAGEGSPAPALDGRALARCPAAADVGDNSRDFGAATPTPGAPNDGFDSGAFCASTSCTPVAPGAVLIAEALVNPVGADAGNEFVELLGPASFVTDGLRLIAINGSNGEAYLGPLFLTGAARTNGRYVIGGAGVEGSDFALPATIQNGPDSLALVDCAGTTIDAVAYGTFGEGTFPAGEGDPAAAPPEGSSLTRVGDADTGDNASDFAAATPTPGLP